MKHRLNPISKGKSNSKDIIFATEYYKYIQDEKSIEAYYNNKYGLNNLSPEEKEELIEIINQKYKRYKIMKYYEKTDLIKDEDIRKAIKSDMIKMIDYLFYDQSKDNIDPIKLKILDLIILKETQNDEKNNIKIRYKNHFKKTKNAENIADRILGNNKNNSNKENDLKDIMNLGKYIKEEIDLDKKLGKDKDNYLREDEINMDNLKSNNNYILTALYLSLNDAGISTVIEKITTNRKILNATLQLIASNMISLKKYNIKLDFGSQSENDKIIINPRYRNKFKKEFIKKVSEFYNLSEDEIVILDLKRGSVNVTFTTTNPIIFQNFDFKKIYDKQFVDITEQALFESCKLSEDLFDPKGNNFGDGYEQYNFIRGGEKYDPPYEWHAYGLKVLNNYDHGNNDWLGHDNNKNEWAVAYHGVGGAKGLRKNIFKNAISISKKNLIPGIGQNYEDAPNIRNETKNKGYHKCKKGVYLTPIIDEAEYWAEEDKFKNKKFKIIIMCRVNPHKIREPNRGDNPPYWILNGNYDEIRPYRILIKEIKKIH